MSFKTLFPNLYKYYGTERRRNFANTQEVLAMFVSLGQCIIIIIIIIIILGISFMQGIYTYIPERNHVPREHCVAAILM